MTNNNNPITDHLDVWTSALLNKSTAGRGSNGKQEAYGIKKLRELILELAVRGKLVPQDPNDESASVLLEKIAVEKERLIKEGKIKKQKSLPELNDEEKPFDLPENWKWTKLGNISFINPRNEAEDKTIVSFVPMSFITTLHTGEHEQEIRQWKEIKNGYTHFANGDIGVAKITPCFENSKAVIFSNLSSGIGAGTTELHVARPYGDTLCARYILVYLKSPEFLIVGESKMTGTAGQKRIPKEFFAENPLPLPPLAEQHRIVAKVDELMALCDQLEQQQSNSIAAHQTLVQTLLDALIARDGGYAGNAGVISGDQAADAAEFEQAWNRIADHFDTLFTTEASIDQLKQTLLQLAVMGKLVPQNLNDEPAWVFLEKTCSNKIQFINKNELNQGNCSPLINDTKLPTGWAWLNFGDLGQTIGGGTPNKSNPKFWDGNIPWISPKDMKIDFISESIDTISEEAIEGSAVKLIPSGSLLLVVRGMILAHSFPVAITRVPVTINQDMKAVAINGFDEGYVLLMMKALKKEFIELVDRSTHGTCKLVSQKLWSKKLPIPPLAEQHRIVAKVDELMALCDTLKARIAAAQTTQIQLADAIVEQAVA